MIEVADIRERLREIQAGRKGKKPDEDQIKIAQTALLREVLDDISSTGDTRTRNLLRIFKDLKLF